MRRELELTRRPFECLQLVKGAPGTRASLVLVSNDADAFKHLQVRKSFCVDPFIAVPQLQGQSGLSGVGELVAVIVGALGLALHTVKPAVFCQLRVIDASGGDLLREELVGANKSGLALGIRVIKSRFLLEREQAAGLTDVAEGLFDNLEAKIHVTTRTDSIHLRRCDGHGFKFRQHQSPC